MSDIPFTLSAGLDCPTGWPLGEMIVPSGKRVSPFGKTVVAVDVTGDGIESVRLFEMVL
jgi:hypothetical protein